MSKSHDKIPKERILEALAHLEEIMPNAAAAADAVDSVLGFMLNHRIDQVPQFTVLKESCTHYRHLAQMFCPQAKRAISELLLAKRPRQKVRMK